MSRKQKFKPAVAVANRADDPYITSGAGSVQSDKFWRWGDDNLFPNALALMARRSVTHRRIINDKADYISGKGFSCDEGHEPLLAAFIRRVNGDGESLRQVLNKLAFDKALFGNAFLEIVTDAEHSFLAFHHQDASRCRVARDSAHILLHHDWAAFNATEARTLPLYPAFERQEDGTLRAMIHYKDYEPMFEHYGVPPYIAGFNVSAIAYKTDKWNISRLDNSFQLSGVMMLDSSVDNEAEAERIVRLAEQKFAGNPGQVMFVIRDGGEGHDGFRVNPLDVHEVLLCARTAPSDPRGCAALETAIKGNRFVDGEESYLDRAMSHMDYNYTKLAGSRWSYPIAELDGFLAMFPPARSERRAIADRVLDSASMRLKTFFALSMPMAEAAGGQDGDEAEGGKHYHRAAAPDGGETAEEE